MAIVYPYNPFNDNDNCRVVETFTVTAQRNVYYPRCTPFFFNKCTVYKNATINPDGTITGTKINPGQQYALANVFNLFLRRYKSNVFSSVVILDPNDGQYVIEYHTIGDKFVLNDAEYAELVANQMNNPREAYWEDFVDVPTVWPSDPHEHPINLVYNVEDLLEAMTQLITVKLSDPNNSDALIRAHIDADLSIAHKAVGPASVGLDKVDNNPTARNTDLNGNTPNAIITVATLKEALRMQAAGTLDLN